MTTLNPPAAGFAQLPNGLKLEKTVSKMTDPIDPQFVREFQESTLAKPVPPDFFETVIRESRKVPARVWHEALRGIRDDDLSEAIPNLRIPALVISSDQDVFVPATDAQHLAAAIPAARHILYA